MCVKFRDILPPVCYCWSVCAQCTMAGRQAGKRREFVGEVWKAACCIDCVWVVNGFLLGSMVEVIKRRHRQDVPHVWPAICSTLTCCRGCEVERLRKRHTVWCILSVSEVKRNSKCYSVWCVWHDLFTVCSALCINSNLNWHSCFYSNSQLNCSTCCCQKTLFLDRKVTS